MFRPGGRSSSKSPRAERPGRRRRALVLGAAAVAILAVGGAIGFRSGGGAIQGSVLTVVPRGTVDREGSTSARRALAVAVRGEAHPRLLTSDFFSAADPSVSFAADRVLFAGRRKEGDAPEIWEMGLRGGAPRVVTPGQGDPGEPIYLPDGRILFSDRAPGSTEARALFSCAPDGSGMERLTFGDQVDRHPALLPDGRVRFVRLATGRSAGEATPLVMHPDGTGISRWEEPESGGAALREGPGMAEFRVVDRVEVSPRIPPPVLTSVVKLAREEWKSGTLLCLDLYDSRDQAVSGLPRGSVARVRVLTGRPGASGGAGRVAEAPVHPDGSFLVEVPADTPLRLELLDSTGRRLAALDRPIWIRPNENRGCVGCHEEAGQAPENRQPLAVTHPPESLFRALTRSGAGDDF